MCNICTAGQPDNWDGTQYCAQLIGEGGWWGAQPFIRPQDQLRYDDEHCDISQRFICEKRADNE